MSDEVQLRGRGRSECTFELGLRPKADLDHRGVARVGNDQTPAVVADDAARNGLQALDHAVIALAGEIPKLEGRARGMDGCIERLKLLQSAFDRFDAPEEEGEVRWFERRGRGFALHITPLDVAGVFGDFRAQVDASWLFTSATLSVRGDFGHFTDPSCKRMQ